MDIAQLYVIVVVIMYMLILLLLTEAFVFQKALQRQGIKYVINLGYYISKKQLREVLKLLEEEGKAYKGQGARITVYGHRWQCIPFYLIRLFMAHISKQEELKKRYRKIMSKDSRGPLLCAGYIDVFDIIEIYEFNFKKISQNEGIDIIKVQLVNAIAHELRHRIQYIHQMQVRDEEIDAEKFAIEFCNKNKEKIKEILNLSDAVTFKDIPSNF